MSYVSYVSYVNDTSCIKQSKIRYELCKLDEYFYESLKINFFFMIYKDQFETPKK